MRTRPACAAISIPTLSGGRAVGAVSEHPSVKDGSGTRLAMGFRQRRHLVRNGENVERRVGRHLRASWRAPTKWRDDPAAPSGADLILRAARCPEPPTDDDLARLSMSLDETLRRPTVASHAVAGPGSARRSRAGF